MSVSEIIGKFAEWISSIVNLVKDFFNSLTGGKEDEK